MKKKSMITPWLFCTLILLSACDERTQAPVTVYADMNIPQTEFAVSRIITALESAHHPVTVKTLDEFDGDRSGNSIALFSSSSSPSARDRLREEGGDADTGLIRDGFSLETTGNGSAVTRWVMGYDDGGMMYGGLELAEQIMLYGLGNVTDGIQNPHNDIRGTKFNIPLDARTPSYSDMSDAAQENIEVMWDYNFWTGYIDHLAQHRYNLISLWNLHPFPSMVSVPEYPDVALDDVKRSTIEFDEYYSTRVIDIAGPDITGQVETLKEITMEEKMEFWRDVMEYARTRNIEFYMITWNIYTYGTEGKYGITDEYTNEITRDYFQKSVKAMFDSYPLLAGIGVTTGENFGAANFAQKEGWVMDTYGEALLDVADRYPDRSFMFVHRLHETGVQSDAAEYAAEANVAAVDIANWFQPLLERDNIDFVYSFKYAQAHIYSSTRQSFHREYLQDIEGMQTLWTLRNDDVYYFRWGAPDFVREFVDNMPKDEAVKGLYLGSDQYIWGREFLSTRPDSPRQLEIDKHWYQWMLWGRMSYNPALDNRRITDLVGHRFPDIDADRLFHAWQEASMVYPVTTGFHWGVYDFHWYIEGSRSRPGPAQTESGFHDVNRFITLPVHNESGYVSIPRYVDHITEGAELTGLTPMEVSFMLHRHADEALEALEGLHPAGNRELRLTLEDIETVAYMGKHYAHKIRGAAELALFRAAGDERHRLEAISQLQDAAVYWRLYASSALTRYSNPLWTNRVGIVDWRESMRHVLNDIAIAGGDPKIDVAIPPLLADGHLIQAGEGSITGGEYITNPDGPESGFVVFEETSGDSRISWDYNAPLSGEYYLEIRYATAEDLIPSAFTVNRNDAADLLFWNTGGENSLASDRIVVNMHAGSNSISLKTNGRVRIAGLLISPVN